MAYRRTERVLARLAGRRAEILAAAADLAARDGLSAINVDDVAAGAGIAVGTLYLHFPNLGELVAAVVAQRLERDLGAIRACHPKDSAAGLAAALGAYLARARLSLPLTRSLAGEPGYWVCVTRELQDAIEAAVRRREIPPCDAGLVAIAVWGALTASVLQGAAGPKTERAIIGLALRAIGYAGEKARHATAKITAN
jgi:AcrR family transcriptional regulator